MTNEQAQILWQIVNKNSEFVKAYQCIMSEPPKQTCLQEDLPYPWSSFEAERGRWQLFIDEWAEASQDEDS